MKKIKLSILSVLVVFSICSCSGEEVIETMFYDDEILFSDYEEYTEPVTEPETYEFSEIPDIPDIPNISDIVHTELVTTEAPAVTKTSVVTSSESESAETAVTTTSVEKSEEFVCIDVPYISQNNEYPTGCELVSASMLLSFYGFNITAGELIDKGYIKQSKAEYEGNEIYYADPNKAFIGNPRSESGYGCYAPALLEGLKKYLEDEYFDAVNLSEISLHDLCMEYIDFGEPVIIWASINMIQTAVAENAWTIKETGEKFNWISNEHCLVLVGYDDDYYYFNDPQKGAAVPYKKETAEKRYKELGSQAITVRPW